MGHLDDALQALVVEHFDRAQLIFMLLTHKLRKSGISLTDEQRDQFRDQVSAQLTNVSSDTVIMSFDIDGIENLDVVDLDITEDDFADLDKLVGDNIEEAVLSAISKLGDLLLTEWKKQAPRLLKKQRSTQSGFNRRLRRRWKRGLELLDVLISTSLEAGMNFNRAYRPDAVAVNDLVFEAVVRLHARGCQIAREIHILLSNGLADGAHARWRTLHEVAVTASFIKEHGADVAERYLLHSGIENYKAALQYQSHCSMLGLRPLAAVELDRLREQHDQLIDKFGPDFKHDYGWASAVLGKKNPTFFDIEHSSKFEHLRPYVKLASANVHASAKGISFRLGLYPGAEILLAGPSVFGLGDPGRTTAFSIMLLTTTLLLLQPSIEHLGHVSAMQMLHREIHEVFYDAEDLIEQENTVPDGSQPSDTQDR